MAETLRRIADELKNRGISFWYDTESPKPGHFTETIEEEIKACEVFLFIWDDGANNSTWCRDEVLSALAHKKHIFLFRVGQFKTENAELNFRLRAFQRSDVDNPPDQERIQNLAETIVDTLRGSRPTWAMVYQREQQLKQLESRLGQEQASARKSTEAKDRQIAELERKLQQAGAQIQTVKDRLAQRQAHMQTLQEQAQQLANELAQEPDLIEELESEWEQEQKLQDKQSDVKSLAVLFIIFYILALMLVGILLFQGRTVFRRSLFNSHMISDAPSNDGTVTSHPASENRVSGDFGMPDDGKGDEPEPEPIPKTVPRQLEPANVWDSSP